MYRLLPCVQDTYITNKIIENTRSLDANVGQAGTLDLYRLVNETTYTAESGSIIELSRLLLQFNYEEIENAGINVSSPTFTASLVLKDIYGGQITPSQFSIILYPLSKSWDEGRGFDVASYKDIDTANFVSASTNVTWSISGANATGSLGQDNIDVITNYFATASFARGDENGSFNITEIVSASIAETLTNHGFRLSFSGSQETDAVTRFVKRFGSRHTYDKSLHPKIIVEYEDRIRDTGGYPHFGVSQSFFVYNRLGGSYRNFFSGSSEITGNDSLILQLITSRSYSYSTSSWQPNFSASINHLTTSILYYSTSFSASQYSDMTGIYHSDFMLDLVTDSTLNTFASGSTVNFNVLWKSLDGNVVYAKDYFTFNKLLGAFNNIQEKNYVVNAINLKSQYTNGDEARIRVIVQDRSTLQTVYRYPESVVTTIIPDMRWRLVKPYENGDVVIPFVESTRMSTDKNGMYFDLFIQDLDINEVYELEFLIKNDVGKDLVVKNKGFIFKVVP